MIPNLFKLLKDFQKFQGEMKKLQEDLASEEVTGSSGAGMVEVVINGKLEVIDVRIERKLLEGKDVQMLQDLIVAAVNDAIKKIQERIGKKFGELTGSLDLPQFDIPGIFNQNQ